MLNGRMIRYQNGFTLIELLMVILILGLVMGSVYSLYVTSQRTATVQDDVVDVQQNLRVATESISRDVRHAGFLIAHFHDTTKPSVEIALNGNTIQPINAAEDNSPFTILTAITKDVFPGQPDRVHADRLTLNSASPFTTFARIAVAQTFVASSGTFTVTTAESTDNFQVDDYVRILNPTQRDQSTNLFPVPILNGPGTVFKVTAIDRAKPTITVDVVSGNSPVNTLFKTGDMLVKIPTATTTFPATVVYCLGPATNCAPSIDACAQYAADLTKCLVRIENGHPEVIASRIAGLQFTYLLDDGKEVPNTTSTLPLADLSLIRAVRVTITGQTAKAVSTTQDLQEKTRVMSTIVKLHNRLIQ